MKKLKIIPGKTNFAFMRLRGIFFVVSCLLMLASILSLSVVRLNFGIDFRGGITIEFFAPEMPALSEIRQGIDDLDIGDFSLREFGAQNDLVLSIEKPPQPAEDNNAQDAVPEDADATDADIEVFQQATVKRVQDALTTLVGEAIQFRRVEVVGPKVSGELINKGIMAVAISLCLMLVYIWFRFEWEFSIAAILALVHDVLITLGIFSVTGIEFTLPIIAALLAIVGYSMNDTVVVFDRIRENMHRFRKRSLIEVLDLSINETLSRTLMTSLTTIIAVLVLFLFGGESLRGFTFTILWGILIGTYSSVFIASPVLCLTGVTDREETATKRV